MIVTFGLLAIGVVLVIYGTVAKNRWGINLDPVYCPRCNTRLPEIRQPQNLRQRFWGGGTCVTCGVEVDKWGRQIGSSTPQGLPVKEQPAVLKQRSRRNLILVTWVVSFGATVVSDFPAFWKSGRIDFAEIIGFLAAGSIRAVPFTVFFYFSWIYLYERPLATIRRRREGARK